MHLAHTHHLSPPKCSVGWIHLLGLGWSAGVLWDTSLESVLELAGNGLEVTAATGTGGLAALGLLGPVVYAIISPYPVRSQNASLLDLRDLENTYSL